VERKRIAGWKADDYIRDKCHVVKTEASDKSL